jgi:hypothetical protein
MPENHNGHGFGYEKRDISARIVLISVAILVVFTVASFIFLKGYLSLRFGRPEPEAATTGREAELTYAGPELLYTPDMGLPELLAAEDSVLTSYGWVYPDSGLVRIPIERAMSILAEKGLPVRAKGRTAEPGDSGISE